MNSPTSNRIPELDGIRGVAIAMVLVWHCFVPTVVAAPGTPLAYLLASARLSWTGVDLFFVLSGFLIGGILLDARGAANYFQAFYSRRFFRIVPIYVALLLIFPLILAVLQAQTRGDYSWLTADNLPYYSYWIFSQNFWMARYETLGASTFAITWSLAIEEQFYLTLPALVRHLSCTRLRILVVGGICFAPLLRMALHPATTNKFTAAFVLMPCRADALLLGVVVAMAMREPVWLKKLAEKRLYLVVSLWTLLAGMGYLTIHASSLGSLLMQRLGYTWVALFYAGTLLFVMTHRNTFLGSILRTGPLRFLGLHAYGIYLFHQGIQGLLFGYFWKSGPRIDSYATLLTTLLGLSVTFGLAKMSWQYVESPLVQFGHKFKYDSPVGPHMDILSIGRALWDALAGRYVKPTLKPTYISGPRLFRVADKSKVMAAFV